jgi:FkbM family methyltransferase
LLKLVPSQNSYIAALCQRYLDRYHGDNNDDIHTNGELSFLKRVIPTSQVVFDVGANRGDWTELVLTINAAATVHCFEPSKPTFAMLSARGFPQNVVVNPFGLSSAAEEKLLYVFEDGSGNNSMYQRRGLEAVWNLKPSEATESIHLETLDRYCEANNVSHIDLLKIDVEGHELEVLRGAAATLARGEIAAVQFEYGGTNIDSGVLLKHLFEFLAPFGYRFYKLFPHEARHIAQYDQGLENFRYQNWVASLKPL